MCMIQSSNDRAEGDKLSTTKLYVEYIIIGMETLGWILLILISILKNEMLNFLDYCIRNITSTIIIVGICYILGLITDRVSDSLLDSRKKRIKAKYKIQSKASIRVGEHINQNNFAAFTLSRIRLLRSTIINAVFLMIVSIWVTANIYKNCKLAIFCGILFLIIAVSANSAHINLLENYYKKVILKKKMKKEVKMYIMLQ